MRKTAKQRCGCRRFPPGAWRRQSRPESNPDAWQPVREAKPHALPTAMCCRRLVWRRHFRTAQTAASTAPQNSRSPRTVPPPRAATRPPRRTPPTASAGPMNSPSTSIASKKPNQCQKIRASINLWESPDSLTPEHALARWEAVAGDDAEPTLLGQCSARSWERNRHGRFGHFGQVAPQERDGWQST